MLDIGNYYERLVNDRLWEYAQRADKRLSAQFFEDVACLALNQLPARYVRHRVDMGSYLTDSEHMEMLRQVEEAVTHAIEQVLNRPHDVRQE